MRRTTFALIFVLLIMAGGIWLQIFLSKKNSKWFGLILPAISFAYSLLMVLSLIAYNGMTGWDIFIRVLFTLLVSNIPTLILVAIYFACREKIKLRKELDKMNVQDLD
ncbi:hypothetical protein [Marasmitruncus massiliensis]|uniref:hypothetical protein n=1 Tax=Marasmitruncus massiliensis TaxID=1944642 RepID=UPI000C7D9116|nr:hypothetical protein [Marasmitruncus massiliensis]MBE6906816.1 hypothetical protein [Oscillospiraceae bacterium]